MAKQLQAIVKFHALGGKATAAPPVGTALGKYGLNLGQFVKDFNARTKGSMGMRVPIVVKVYSDRTYDLETKSPHSVDMIKQAAGIETGAHNVPKDKVGTIKTSQLEEIVKAKKKDLNARELEQGVRTLAGTCRSMGVDVVDG